MGTSISVTEDEVGGGGGEAEGRVPGAGTWFGYPVPSPSSSCLIASDGDSRRASPGPSSTSSIVRVLVVMVVVLVLVLLGLVASPRRLLLGEVWGVLGVGEEAWVPRGTCGGVGGPLEVWWAGWLLFPMACVSGHPPPPSRHTHTCI